MTYQSHLVTFKERCAFLSAKALQKGSFRNTRQAFCQTFFRKDFEGLKRTDFPTRERRSSCNSPEMPVNQNLPESEIFFAGEIRMGAAVRKADESTSKNGKWAKEAG